jgi:phage terminase large subunit
VKSRPADAAKPTPGRGAPLKNPALLLKIELPRRFGFLLELHPYKVAHGGRNGLKSWSFADAILALGANQQLRIVCGREVMKSLADSVHKLLSDRIKALGLSSFYRVTDNKIRGRNGTEISYAGLSDQTDESIKSFEAVDIFWAEEAQGISDRSWAKLLPTIRKPGSEVWVSFNADLIDDATYKRFVVNPPPGAVVVKTTWEYAKACGFFTEKMEALRLHDKKQMPKEEYENIWEGKPRVAVAGAIYSREVIQMIEEGRYRPIPYDPRFPVEVIWDLGWNDAMTQIFVQKPHPSVLNIINYREVSFKRYDELIAERQNFRYRIVKDWLPHDGEHHDPKSGTNAKKLLEGMGCTVEILKPSDPEARIRAGRQLFPRIYLDNTAREVTEGWLGGPRLMECFKKYRRVIPKTTNEPGGARHDEFSHGSDGFGTLGEIAERISSEFIKPLPPTLPGYSNADPSMGMLG